MASVMTRRSMLGGLSALGALAGRGSQAQPAALEKDAFAAWLFALPAIEMAGVRERLSHWGGYSLANNRLLHAPRLAGIRSRSVTAPNRDTLNSTAFIDLSKGPVTVDIPEAGDRYLSVAVLNMYTDVDIVIGPRQTGGKGGSWRLIGPGDSARDARDLRLGTPHGWMIARTLADGDSDIAAAQRLQRAITLSGPESRSNETYAGRADAWTPYFRSAQSLLESDPRSVTAGLDAFERLRRISARGDFDRAGYPPDDAQAIDSGVAKARTLAQTGNPNAVFIDGWAYPQPNLGRYGDDSIYRARVAVSGIGALPLEEAMYMRAAGDGAKSLFHGDGLYRLHLAKPVPAEAFWSLTMYEATADGQFFFTANPLGRYTIGDRTRGLMHNPDGSLDIWIGRSDPGGSRTANWLPAPKSGPYSLTMRAYLPKAELRDGHYRLPPIMPA